MIAEERKKCIGKRSGGKTLKNTQSARNIERRETSRIRRRRWSSFDLRTAGKNGYWAPWRSWSKGRPWQRTARSSRSTARAATDHRVTSVQWAQALLQLPIWPKQQAKQLRAICGWEYSDRAPRTSTNRKGGRKMTGRFPEGRRTL